MWLVGIDNGDYAYTISGGVLALWFIVDSLSGEFKIFEKIQVILGTILGIAIFAFGIVGVVVEKDSVFYLFVILGLVILLNYLIPLIVDYRNRKENKDSNIGSTLK